MRISTKGRYGLRAMVDLAIYSENEHVSIKSIAERQDISDNYLEQVFSTLRKAGLVKSIKGSQGGYILGRSPSDIKVSEILMALEGSLKVVDSIFPNKNDAGAEYIISQYVWNKINEGIRKVVEDISLEMLVNEYKKLNANENYMYYI